MPNQLKVFKGCRAPLRGPRRKHTTASSVQSVFIFWAVSFRVRANKHVPSIGTLFLKEARSLIKVCYEQKGLRSKKCFHSS